MEYNSITSFAMKENENTNELNQNSEETNLNVRVRTLKKEISSENEIKPKPIQIL